jgi:hypothetical protein
MKNLISMTDFVLEKQIARIKPILKLCYIESYANFLKQPLEKWMFVPCDEDGNVLEDCGLIPCYELDQYRKAKERCLFESENKYCFETILLCKKNIEDITNFNFQLTPTALKQIGL